MSTPNQPPAPRAGLSLYANLLDPNGATTAATVSRGPVVFKNPSDAPEDASAKKHQIDAGR